MMVRRLDDLESDLFRVLDWKRRTLTYKLKVEERLGCDIDGRLSKKVMWRYILHSIISTVATRAISTRLSPVYMTKLSVVLTMLIFIF